MARALLKYARLTRRQLIAFALFSAVLNGVITASVGAWLGQAYAKYQARRQSIETLVHLVYERRTRSGLVASAIRRGADIDELRYRKRAYDEAYVDWNKNVMQNIFAIREVTGEHMISGLEKYYEDGLVAAMANVDRCLTKAYDVRIAQGDGAAELTRCDYNTMHQLVLDCGATFTNELYKMTKLSFLPYSERTSKEGREISEMRIKAACLPDRKPEVKPETPAEHPHPQTASPEPQAPMPGSTAPVSTGGQ
ncbi:MAG: hypothetical protein R3D51_06630 [Hyphomicrobiaceae bacterium]